MKILSGNRRNIMINISILFFALFIFFTLTAETLPPPPFENFNAEQQKGLVGTSSGAKTKQLFSSFIDEETIYVVWTGMDKPDVYYSYYPARDPSTGEWTANGWSDEKILVDAVESNNYAKLGVEPVIFTPSSESDEKQVCLFMKGYSEHDNPLMFYMCTSHYVGSDNGSEPEFSWQGVMREAGRQDTVVVYEVIDGIASTKHKASDPHAFYYMQSQLWLERPDDPNDYYIEVSRVTSRKPTSDNPNYLEFTRVGERTPTKLSSPSLFLQPDDLSLLWPYYIFYNHTKYGRKMYYAGVEEFSGKSDDQMAIESNDDPIQTEVFDRDGYKLTTAQRTFNYRFKNNIYLAFKAETNEKVYFTQINELDFQQATADGKNGWKKWKHCKFFLGTTTDAARTPVGPALFEYNDALYILYADHLSGNRISYIRIDNIRNPYGYLSEDTPYHCGMGY